MLILLAILALGGLGYGVWKGLPAKDAAAPSPTANPTAPAPNKTTDIPQSPNDVIYKSDDLDIEFKHPKAWTVSEANDGLRITSPDFQYKTVASGEKTGNFRVYIRKGARDIDGSYIGKGVAIKPSEKLVYANPGVGQRPDTLISSFGLATPDNFAFFLIAGNFQLKAGDTLGPSYGREPETFIIAGGYASKDLSDDLATNPVPLDSLANSQAYRQAVAIVKSLKL